MNKPTLSCQQATQIIHNAFQAIGCPAMVTERDVFVSEDVVILGFANGTPAKQLFDFVFPRSASGVYYHYAPYETFQAIVSTGKLRCFSAKKKNSVGEFRPFCIDYHLDGYVRKGATGAEEGEAAELMDSLFCKSFVASPTEAAQELWETFAQKHKGVRLKFEINIHPDYLNFRYVAYQGTDRVPLVKALQDAFAGYGRSFVTLGLSKMGGFYQLGKFSYQKEYRLLIKRQPNDPQFPFTVGFDKDQNCNFIDCDLIKPTCQGFQIKLTEVAPGRLRPIGEVQAFIKDHSVIQGLKAVAL